MNKYKYYLSNDRVGAIQGIDKYGKPDRVVIEYISGGADPIEISLEMSPNTAKTLARKLKRWADVLDPPKARR